MFVATMLSTSTLGSGSGSVDMAWDGAAAGTAARATVLRHTPALHTAAPQTAATQPPLQLPRRNVLSGADIGGIDARWCTMVASNARRPHVARGTGRQATLETQVQSPVQTKSEFICDLR